MEYSALHTVPWQNGSFWVAVAVVIFAVLFARRIVTPVVAMLDARTASVSAALAEASRLKDEAQAMLADAKTKSEQASQDAAQILASAHQEAERISADLAAEAAATARRREQMALTRIAAAEKAALNDVRAAAIDIATAAAMQILRQKFDEAADAAMIDQAIAAVPAALRQAV